VSFDEHRHRRDLRGRFAHLAGAGEAGDTAEALRPGGAGATRAVSADELTRQLGEQLRPVRVKPATMTDPATGKPAKVGIERKLYDRSSVDLGKLVGKAAYTAHAIHTSDDAGGAFDLRHEPPPPQFLVVDHGDVPGEKTRYLGRQRVHHVYAALPYAELRKAGERGFLAAPGGRLPLPTGKAIRAAIHPDFAVEDLPTGHAVIVKIAVSGDGRDPERNRMLHVSSAEGEKRFSGGVGDGVGEAGVNIRGVHVAGTVDLAERRLDPPVRWGVGLVPGRAKGRYLQTRQPIPAGDIVAVSKVIFTDEHGRRSLVNTGTAEKALHAARAAALAARAAQHR
jgi:hypothetical protein